jgi:flagellar hook protein FlgE
MIVYDSLGNPVEVRLRLAMESKTTNGNTWRFYVESPDDSDASAVVGTGTITFDQNGQFVSATGTDIQVDRADTGAASPLALSLDFSNTTGLSRGAADPTLVMTTQDGYPAGTLIDYGIDEDGIITGTFSNSQTRVYGQVAVATFANAEGLIAKSENTFVPGANSGEAVVGEPRTLAAGSIRAGALEQSNVELSREFIGLVQASTGFSAASRVVRTADDMLQELLLLAR